jgi:anaerobic selenocysteine-containing dehydrogenase
LKKEQEKLPENEEKTQSAGVSRRDFLVGAGTVVVGGAIGASVLSGCGGTTTETVKVTETKTVPTTVTTTSIVGSGEIVTVTAPGGGETVTRTTTVTAGAAEEEIKSYVKMIDHCCFAHGGAVSRVDSKNGKILRIRPLWYEEKYATEDYAWSVDVKGKTFKPVPHSAPNALDLSYKKRVYSPNRIKYPLQRVDWEPGGDPEKINAQNRGKSKFKRISWDEATTIIADEIKRVTAKYGPYACLLQGDGHGETKFVHGPHGCQTQMWRYIGEGDLQGEYTLQIRTPDSWEGWYWGAKHMWGMNPFGTMTPATNCWYDYMENAEMLLYQGGDPDTTTTPWKGNITASHMYFLNELGIRQIWICPDLNYSAAIYAYKWIPTLPCQDAALELAIAYTWFVEDTYDKEYVETHTYGFDKWKAYVIGETDGVPKTPAWAAPRVGVPSYTIKALAREWAKKVTSFAMNGMGGSICRGPYSTEPTRMEVACMGMQGLGKPGRHLAAISGSPAGAVGLNPFSCYRGLGEVRWHPAQLLPKTRIHDAILDASMDNPLKFYSTGSPMMPIEDQFVQYQYPIPADQGGSELHFIWSDTPCWTTCWNGGNRYIEAMKSSKIETIIVQHPWMENDTLYSDIILPINTFLEENDIGMTSLVAHYGVIFPSGQTCDSIGESMSDYEAVGEVAKKMGIYDEYTGGMTVDEWIKYGFDTSGATSYITWEELQEKGYWVVPVDPDWKSQPVGLAGFYEDPEANPLATNTGLLEYEATGLVDNFPDDMERPPIPQWVIGGPGKYHDESIDVENGAERCKTYPLLVISNHPRWRLHAEMDDNAWLREIPTCKIKGPDGYAYEPVWINPSDAEARGIKNGDIVSMYNERGTVLSGAYVTERIRPGAVYQDHGARIDMVVDGPDEYIDRGGANNLICPDHCLSPNTQGQVGSGFLVEIKKADLGALREKYPESFNKEYDPETGITFNSWVEGGMD